MKYCLGRKKICADVAFALKTQTARKNENTQLPVKQWLQSWLEARGAAGQTLALWAPRVLAPGLLVLSYGLLVTGSFNPFIYFQF